MFSIYKEVHAPTGVELSTYCYFFDRREKNLVISGSDYVKVFRFVPDPFETAPDESKAPKMKLECMGDYRFFGNIVAMESMSLSLARDALLLTFQDAKLAIVEYDPDTHDLRTISIHYFETDDLKGGSLERPNSILRVDPEDRCAALLIYNRQLVIIPFMRRDAVFDENFSEKPDVKPNIASLSRIPALRSYTIDLRELDERLDNIVDFKFLHGYYEPTIVFVFEPIKTYVGRLAVRQDTCALAAVSLNISQKVHPIIWTMTQLPYDCCAVYAVPKPIGGVLVMAQNSLLYLNQSVPPYCVALNSVAPKSTNFPMKTQEDVAITLDCCHADFLSANQMIISLKTGDLYILTLLCDTMRSVRGFHFDKAASSVLTTCLMICDKDFVFLGSRLGNSLLLRLNEKGVVREVIQDSELVANGEKRAEDIDLTGFEDDDDDLIRVKKSRMALDQEEVEVYGSERRSHFTIRTFSFDVCDSLLNIGPCGQMIMGEPAFLSDDFHHLEDPDLEIVTTSGMGKNGALCVLQRSIRPHVVTTIGIPSMKNFWTLYDNETTALHGLVVVSQEAKTLVVQTDEEINQVVESGFRTDNPTVFACNIGKNKFIVQVVKNQIRLLTGLTVVQQIDLLDLNSDIVFGSIADPYLTLLTEDGRAILVTLTGDQLEMNITQLHKKGNVTAVCTYCDTSGLFTTEVPSDESPEEQIVKISKIKKEVRDEDELLYGNVDAADTNFKKQQAASTTRWWRRNRLKYQNFKSSFWLLIGRESGALEIYSLPDMKIRMNIVDFGQTPKILGHTTSRNVPETEEPTPTIHEVLLVGLGHEGRRPIMFCRVGLDVTLYEVYPFYEDAYENVLKIRFAKIKNHMILRERKSAKPKDSSVAPFSIQLRNHFRHFPYLAGYSGVFICGPYPHWAFLTTLGELRLHPMGIDSKILAFGAFNNPNCPHGGYIYANADSDFRICVLSKHLSYDSPWPVRKIPVRCTAHFIAYHLESKTYCVALSETEPSAKICRVAGEEKEFIDEQKDERFPLPLRLKFSLNIYSPETWEVVPNTKQEMEPFETILCLKVVNLAYEGSRSGLRGYVAVGTNYSYGEDTTSRGRIMVLDIIDVVPEPGQPLTKNKFKTLYTKEHKGPVTAVESVVGFLCAAVGQKLYLWQLKDNDLVGIAFIDTQIYVHQMQAVKNLILIADVYKSIALLRFQEKYRTLAVVSRDFRPLEVYGVSFLIDNTQLGLIATDRDKNIVVYMFQPQSKESFGGQRLIRKADFHVGHQILSFARVRCKLVDPSTTKRNSVAIEKRVVTFFCTLDGSLGYLLPIPERVYRRLLMLQSVLNNQLAHRASLNPKAYRTLQCTDRTIGNPTKGVIDGDLVWEFLGLSFADKSDVSKKIGCSSDDIIEDLMEIDRISAHF